jgi:Bacterial protein of unknown function (DUF885)
MMTKARTTLAAVGSLLLGIACGPPAPPDRFAAAPPVPKPAPVKPIPNPDYAFSTYREQLLDTWLERWPATARQAGLHDFDAKLSDYSAAGSDAHIKFLRQAEVVLARYAVRDLTAEEALDLAILKSRTELRLNELVERRRPQTEPLYYKELFDVAGYIDFNYAPLPARFAKLVAHQEAAVGQASNVLASLEPVLSKPIVETAVKVYRGYASYLSGDLAKLMKGVGDATLQARFSKSNAALAQHAKTIADRLEKEWLPRANMTRHVLGREGFSKFVKAQEGRAIELDTFRSMALKDLARNKSAYEKLIKDVKITRPEASELLASATALMNASRQYVLDKGLMTIPSEDRCMLKETPPFMRWNAAFLNMPGPFDTAKEAYYYITLPDPSWSEEEQKGYIFPHGVLSSTTIHEVYPGHFLHGLWVRQAPTRAQKIFDSYSFTEGWAHYVEEMMIEQGWAKDDPQRHLGQLSDALLRNCRFVAALEIHVDGKSLDEVAKRFETDCFQDKATAREQAVRGTFDPGYFAYTLGKLQIIELREDLKKQLGDRFDLKRFHDAMMAYGAPPVALIRDRVAASLGGK